MNVLFGREEAVGARKVRTCPKVEHPQGSARENSASVGNLSNEWSEYAPPVATRLCLLDVPAPGGDLPLVHDRAASGDDQHVGEVDGSADVVGGDANERPKIR